MLVRVGCLVLVLVACAGNPGSDLSVDLRTDYVPGGDFNTVVVTIPDREPVRVLANSFEDFINGVRVAEFDGLSASDFRVSVDLLSNSGTVVASRETEVQLRGDLAVTVVITQSCRGIVCPNGNPNETECVGGICVDPGCTPETPERCPSTPACVSATECPAPAQTCFEAQCVDGFCLYGDDGSCGMGEFCSAERGCTQRPTGDASVPDGGGDAGVDAPPSICDGVVCDGFTFCDETGSCRNYEGCFADEDCPGEFPLCRNNNCVPPSRDIDGDGSPAGDDCDETNPDISPLAMEVCNLIDDDCNEMIDDGNPGVLCAAEGGECMDGVCGCPPNQYDIDGVPDTGCECTSDPATGVATACADAQDLGTLSDAGSGQTTLITGNLVPEGREVWYRFRGVDSADTACDNYHVRVQFMDNPDDAYRFVVFRGDCATALCPATGFTDFTWATDFRDGMGTGECPCSAAPQGAPGQNTCSDDSADFFVQVIRRDGAALACAPFTLELSNGVYDTP